MMEFVTMQVYSSYSLLNSTIRIREYVEYGKQLGYTTLALTDKEVLHAAIEFYEECLKQRIRPIIGMELELKGLIYTDQMFPILLYAKNKEGYSALMKLSTMKQAHVENKQLIHLIQESAQHLKVLIPSEGAEWLRVIKNEPADIHEQYLQTVSNVFKQVEVALGIDEKQIEDASKNAFLKAWANPKRKVVAHKSAYYLRPDDDYSWRVVQAVDKGLRVDQAQVEMTGIYYLHRREAVEQLYQNEHAHMYMQQLEDFVKDLHVEIPLHQVLLPKFTIPASYSDAATYLAFLCNQSMIEKGLNNKAYTKRLEMELDVIHQMGFDDYFLIVWDLMQFAHQQQIQTGPGRGSAAGSLVSYLLNITKVDPIRFGLLFERFLNKERYTMPDIDLDFPDNKREKILEYVQEKYGEEYVAQIATFGTLAAKQSLRDVGRVMGLSVAEMNQWSQAVPNRLNITLEEAFKESHTLKELVEKTPRNTLLFDTAKRIEGLPRHLSTHAAGVVISHQPLVTYTPLVHRGDTLPITQYTMKDVEKIGLLKMDFLGLKNLTILHDAVQYVAKLTGKALHVDRIPLQDQPTLELFQAAQTNGIFQFESDGIRQVLKKVLPTSLEDIASVNALFRPGPMEQIDHFAKRKHGKEAIYYIHDTLKPILDMTYGIMVYQEQVMQVTSTMAGFTLGEADILRRAIGKKNHAEIERQKEKFIDGAVKKGYASSIATQVYQYIEKFANYGFNRSHAFAYSLLAYQLAYIKVHYPIAFFAALMNSTQPMSKKLQDYIIEAKNRGVLVLAPSVQKSIEEYSVSEEGIRIGLSAIKGLRKDCILALLQTRYQHGKFKDFFDLGFRLGKKHCKKEALEALIYSGACDEFGETRASLVHHIDTLIETVHFSGDSLSLLDEADEMMPKFERIEEWDILKKIDDEIAVLGYSLSGHPTEEFSLVYQSGQLQRTAEVYEKAPIQTVGILKNVKKIQTKKGQRMAFAQLQDSAGRIELTIFPAQYAKAHDILQNGQYVYVSGRTERNRMNEWTLQVNSIEPIEQFRKRQSTMQRPQKCYIRIDARHSSAEVRDRLKQLLQRFQGDVPVYFVVGDDKKVFQPSDIARIAPSQACIFEVEKLLGEDTIKIID